MTKVFLPRVGEGFSIDLGNLDVPWPVADFLEYDNLIFVRLEVPTGKICNQNVLALTRGGKLLWKIQESPHGTQVDRPFMGISVNGDNQLVASNWNGIDYLVNVENGELSVSAIKK